MNKIKGTFKGIKTLLRQSGVVSLRFCGLMDWVRFLVSLTGLRCLQFCWGFEIFWWQQFDLLPKICLNLRGWNSWYIFRSFFKKFISSKNLRPTLHIAESSHSLTSCRFNIKTKPKQDLEPHPKTIPHNFHTILMTSH